MIQCGSYTGNGAQPGGPTITLGWEPQYLMVKRATTGTGDWFVNDNLREGLRSVDGVGSELSPDSTGAEGSVAGFGKGFTVKSTGFNVVHGAATINNNGDTYIYMAIRRPNKPPTSGTQVYNAIARTGTGSAGTVTGVGFALDLLITSDRSQSFFTCPEDRLRGAGNYLITGGTNSSGVEGTNAGISGFDTMDGFRVGVGNIGNASTYNFINWCFKRAPEVFDQICYTGTGGAHTETHNLGAAPEFWIVKIRTPYQQYWVVGSTQMANTDFILMDDFAKQYTDSSYWNSTYPTSSGITFGTNARVNYSGSSYVAYLFATKAGVSKVGSYTGDGTAGKIIDCGFSAGARFILIKRTDDAGHWYVFDSARGIVAANDPHLSINSTSAEVTDDDSVDPTASGFIVNQVAATNINVTNATYIFLAFA